MIRNLLGACVMLVLAGTAAAPALGQDSSAVDHLKQRLELSALAAHGKTQGIEARLSPSDVATLQAIGVASGAPATTRG